MAIRSFSSALIALSFVSLFGCQTVSRRTSAPQPESAPNAGAPSMPVPSPVQTLPPPQREEAKRVAVILGPGGAKAYAHAGVLKAFQQQRIPVEKVVGLEWGALMGAFFANKGQAHDMEWKLYRMEQQNLPKPHGGFFSKSEDTVHVMDRFLNDIFGKDDVANSKIAFTCPSRSVWSGVISWQSRGPFKEAIKRCLAYPPVFKVKSSYMAGATQAVEAIEMLAREGFNVIIFVNVLGSAMPVAQEKLQDHMNQVILWQEVKRALNEASRLRVETVNVDTSAYPIVRFESRKDLMSLGERVGTQAAEQLISKYHF